MPFIYVPQTNNVSQKSVRTNTSAQVSVSTVEHEQVNTDSGCAALIFLAFTVSLIFLLFVWANCSDTKKR